MSVEFRPMRSVIYVDVCREEYRHRLQHWLYGHHIQDSISNFGPYVTKYAFYNALPVPPEGERFGTRRFFCADELFLRAGRPLPEEEYYEGYRQLENGVGMLRSLGDDFLAALDTVDVPEEFSSFTIATGTAAAPFLTGLVQQAQARFPDLRGEVVAIDNDFFGHTIDVAGLLTGQDISAQLQKRPLGDRVLIPLHMLRHGETVFLDDYTVERLSQELGRPVQVVGLDGFDLADALFAPAESRQDNGRS